MWLSRTEIYFDGTELERRAGVRRMLALATNPRMLPSESTMEMPRDNHAR
jgi:hypothetical protein